MDAFGPVWLRWDREFGTNERCYEFVEGVRWGRGFVCPKCGGKESWRVSKSIKNLAAYYTRICRGCGQRTSLTKGTIFEKSQVDLRTWFEGLRLFLHGSLKGDSVHEFWQRINAFRARTSDRPIHYRSAVKIKRVCRLLTNGSDWWKVSFERNLMK